MRGASAAPLDCNAKFVGAGLLRRCAVALAKQQWGKLKLAFCCSSACVASELMQPMAGIKLNYAPYRANSPAVIDWVGAQTDEAIIRRITERMCRAMPIELVRQWVEQNDRVFASTSPEGFAKFQLSAYDSWGMTINQAGILPEYCGWVAVPRVVHSKPSSSPRRRGSTPSSGRQYAVMPLGPSSGWISISVGMTNA